MSCRVAGCRFPWSHVTSGHRCPICGAFGHGQRECGDFEQVERLRKCSDVMPGLQCCAVAGCARPQTHMTSAHHCEICSLVGRHHEWCNLATRYCVCPICRKGGSVDLERDIIYTDAKCLACDSADPLILLPCRHAPLCRECLQKLR